MKNLNKQEIDSSSIIHFALKNPDFRKLNLKHVYDYDIKIVTANLSQEVENEIKDYPHVFISEQTRFKNQPRFTYLCVRDKKQVN